MIGESLRLATDGRTHGYLRFERGKNYMYFRQLLSAFFQMEFPVFTAKSFPQYLALITQNCATEHVRKIGCSENRLKIAQETKALLGLGGTFLLKFLNFLLTCCQLFIRLLCDRVNCQQRPRYHSF